MVRGYRERIAELEQALECYQKYAAYVLGKEIDMSSNSESWNDSLGCRDVSLAEDYIAELEADNRRMRKVMQRYIDCQDNAKNNWVLDFLQVLEEEK